MSEADPFEGESRAVRERYARRTAVSDDQRYSMANPATWQTVQERQRAILGLLAARGISNLHAIRLTEVGCGAGGNLLELLQLGFSPEKLTGIELLSERADRARSRLPTGVQILNVDALGANLEDESQDIVYQAVVFSSLLDDAYQQGLASRMWRWLKPGGGVLWYDFVYNNPANPDVRGVPLSRIVRLFPAGVVRWRRVTLAPPVARLVTRLSPGLYNACNVIPWLRTHVVCWISKPPEAN